MEICILVSFLVYILISEGPGRPRMLACRHIRLSSPFLGRALLCLSSRSGEIFERIMGDWSLQILSYSRELEWLSRLVPEKPA